MREIKFRVWDITTRTMDFDPLIYGSNEMGECWINNSIKREQDKGIVFMQFTGLKDKNGKEIYEGDILEFETINAQVAGYKNRKGIVEYEEKLAWWIINGDMPYLLWMYYREAKIIGNIYENSNLLKQEG